MQYNTKDGLAGSTVYDMCQDKDGFMWFATENGLSRFDGTKFVTFTVKDGLPDNEVLKLFEDSKGRLWVGTFSKYVCYIYKNKVYNKSNTRFLEELIIPGSALSFVEDAKGNLIVSDNYNLFLVTAEDEIKELNSLPQISSSKTVIKAFLRIASDSSIVFVIKDSLFLFEKMKLVYVGISAYNPTKFEYRRLVSRQLANYKEAYINLPDIFFGQFNILGVAYLVSTSNGAWIIDTTQNKLGTHLLAGKKVSKALLDTETNMWFSTLGEGVYKLPSLEIRNVSVGVKHNLIEKEVFALANSGNNLLTGLGFSKVLKIKGSTIEHVYDFKKFLANSNNKSSRNGIKAIETKIDGITFFGTDAYLLKQDGNQFSMLSLVAIKSIDALDRKHIAVATARCVCKVNVDNLSITDTLYDSRSTKVACVNGSVYVGTLNGLHIVKPDKSDIYLGNLSSALSRRITDIKQDSAGRIWVATSDAGVVCLKDGKVMVSFSDKDQLSSNICKCLFIDGRYVYIGSNKGLDRLDIANNYQHVRYSAADGLPSDIINAVCKIDKILYIGTPAGITYFEEEKIAAKSICKLTVFSAVVSNRVTNSGAFLLSSRQNNINIKYVAVSFKSEGDILYSYRLLGESDKWRTTSDNSVTFPSLDAGDYEFQLYATNKFGVVSNVYAVKFKIELPFYKTWWFISLILLLNIGTIALYFYWKNIQNEKKFIEKNNLQKAFAALEQQALQAQMNPHFVFNCLNSIQQFILTNDRENANLYLTGFASLIRQTLYLSAKKSVTVIEEAKYLSSYLEMEKMRYGDNFSFSITGYDNPEVLHLEIPALFLQPFVENSLRHGIRHKKTGKGTIDVQFNLNGDKLFCFITDNGIGRQQSEKYKSGLHVEYQSRGIGLARKRIDLFNQMNDQKIVFDIIDLFDENKIPLGTKVIIEIPV